MRETDPAMNETDFEAYLTKNYKRLLKKFKGLYGNSNADEMESWAFNNFKKESERLRIVRNRDFFGDQALMDKWLK